MYLIMYGASFPKTPPIKPQPCHIWSFNLCFVTTLSQAKVVVSISRLLQCGNKVVATNKVVPSKPVATTLYFVYGEYYSIDRYRGLR